MHCVDCCLIAFAEVHCHGENLLAASRNRCVGGLRSARSRCPPCQRQSRLCRKPRSRSVGACSCAELRLCAHLHDLGADNCTVNGSSSREVCFRCVFSYDADEQRSGHVQQYTRALGAPEVYVRFYLPPAAMQKFSMTPAQDSPGPQLRHITAATGAAGVTCVLFSPGVDVAACVSQCGACAQATCNLWSGHLNVETTALRGICRWLHLLCSRRRSTFRFTVELQC